MAVSANMAAAMQKKYQNSMRSLMSESKGGKMRELAEQAIGKGNEEVVFYRLEDGTVFKGELDMYSPTWQSTAGSVEKFSTKIAYVYWSHKVKESELNSTNLSPDSQFLKSGVNSLKVNEDVEIMNIIKSTAGIRTEGDTLKTLVTNIDDLIGTAKLSILEAKEAVDVPRNTAMIMNRSTYKKLFSTDIAKNNDYVQLSGSGGEVAIRFYGTEVITFPDKNLPENAIFFVPSMSFGFAAWENGTSQNAQFMPWDDSMWLTAKSSMGAVVLDKEAIVKWVFKP